MSDIPKVLCVGTPSDLLESRKLVLQSAGYDPTCLGTIEAIKALLTTSFDVMVISVTVPEEEQETLANAASEPTRVVQLTGLTFPQELLRLIRR